MNGISVDAGAPRGERRGRSVAGPRPHGGTARRRCRAGVASCHQLFFSSFVMMSAALMLTPHDGNSFVVKKLSVSSGK